MILHTQSFITQPVSLKGRVLLHIHNHLDFYDFSEQIWLLRVFS